MLWNHHDNQNNELIYHPQNFSHNLLQYFPVTPSCSQPPSHPQQILICHCRLVYIFKNFLKWNSSVCTFLKLIILKFIHVVYINSLFCFYYFIPNSIVWIYQDMFTHSPATFDLLPSFYYTLSATNFHMQVLGWTYAFIYWFFFCMNI